VRLYEYIRVIAPGMALQRREALAAAARSRGVETSVDEEIEAIRRRLSDHEASVPTLSDARRRVAETEAALEERRERVATLRGRVQASEDDAVTDEYRMAIRDLSEAETAHLAAMEALENARSRARSARDERDRRLRLQDRLENRRREARAELIESVRPDADEAVASAPGGDGHSFEGADSVTAALAVARVGTVHAPVTLACRRFSDATEATAWLEAPVYWL
jgi:preprotein translocase subunit SecD